MTITRLTIIVLGFGMLASSSALAAERTVTLAVQNMFCADCSFFVKKSLEAVPGVAKATVSFKDKTAIVTYDDDRATLRATRTRPPKRAILLRQKADHHDP